MPEGQLRCQGAFDVRILSARVWIDRVHLLVPRGLSACNPICAAWWSASKGGKSIGEIRRQSHPSCEPERWQVGCVGPGCHFRALSQGRRAWFSAGQKDAGGRAGDIESQMPRWKRYLSVSNVHKSGLDSDIKSPGKRHKLSVIEKAHVHFRHTHAARHIGTKCPFRGSPGQASISDRGSHAARSAG